MDSGEFSCIKPNNLAPLIAAVTTSSRMQIVPLQRSGPYLSVSIPAAQSSINRHPPLMKKMIFLRKNFLRLGYFDFCIPQNSCNSHHLRIIVKLLLLPMIFSIKSLHVKSCMSLFLCCAYLLALSYFISRLW